VKQKDFKNKKKPPQTQSAMQGTFVSVEISGVVQGT